MTDSEFIRAFENCEIPKDQWKHRDHIRMAWIYLTAHPYETALRKIREGIQKLNLSYGNKTGYHDTVTCLFVIYIWNSMGLTQSFDAFYTKNSWLSDGKNPFRKKHYSDELWNSQATRDTFVAPDLIHFLNLGVPKKIIGEIHFGSGLRVQHFSHFIFKFLYFNRFVLVGFNSLSTIHSQIPMIRQN